MAEEGIRTRRNFPAETWAVVRDAYLGGETAESISKRLNLSVNTIRKRASRCGWTHRAHAQAIDRRGAERVVEGGASGPVDPRDALSHATRAAARLLAEGRGAEASQMVRAAQGLAELMARDDVVLTTPLSEDADAAAEGELRKLRLEVDGLITERADALARDMLSDRVALSGTFGAFAYHWRAAVLGPEVAAMDRERAMAVGPWAVTPFWDEAGALRPVRALFDQDWSTTRNHVRGSHDMAYRPNEPEWED